MVVVVGLVACLRGTKLRSRAASSGWQAGWRRAFTCLQVIVVVIQTKANFCRRQSPRSASPPSRGACALRVHLKQIAIVRMRVPMCTRHWSWLSLPRHVLNRRPCWLGPRTEMVSFCAALGRHAPRAARTSIEGT